MSSQKKKKKNKHNGRQTHRYNQTVRTNDSKDSVDAENIEESLADEVKSIMKEPVTEAEDIIAETGEQSIQDADGEATEIVIEDENAEPEPESDDESDSGESYHGKTNRTKKTVLIVVLALLGVLVILLVAYFVLRDYINDRFLNKINYETTAENFTVIEDIPTEPAYTFPYEDETKENIDNIDKVEEGLIQADAKTFFYSGEVAEANYITNILLIGTDVRPNKEWNGNSDSMILLSINNKTKKVIMTSFMRDIYVYIPMIDRCEKLNYAHASGGSELLCQTITGMFKIKVDKYVRVDFYGLMDIIDAAGGVDMYVSSEELPVLNQYITDMCAESGTGMIPDNYYLHETGDVHLSGMQAVAYARIRYVGNSDFERTNRQRKVLTQVIDNCKSMNFMQIANLADVALPRISTNMGQTEVWSLVNDAMKYIGYEVETQRLPFDDTYTLEYIGNQEVILPDYVTNIQMMIDGIYEE